MVVVPRTGAPQHPVWLPPSAVGGLPHLPQGAHLHARQSLELISRSLDLTLQTSEKNLRSLRLLRRKCQRSPIRERCVGSPRDHCRGRAGLVALCLQWAVPSWLSQRPRSDDWPVLGLPPSADLKPHPSAPAIESWTHNILGTCLALPGFTVRARGGGGGGRLLCLRGSSPHAHLP